MGKSSLAALLGLALIMPFSTASADAPCWLGQNEPAHEEISTEQAFVASEGIVLFHFGSGVPKQLLSEISQAVSNQGYRVCSFAGGPNGKIDLFVDTQQSNRLFEPLEVERFLSTAELEKRPLAYADVLGTLAVFVGGNADDLESIRNVPITSEQALAWSNGRVLLHYGDGFSEFRLSQMQTLVQDRGLEMVYLPGGPEDGVRVYMYGNEIPKTFTRDEADKALLVVFGIAENNGLLTEQ